MKNLSKEKRDCLIILLLAIVFSSGFCYGATAGHQPKSNPPAVKTATGVEVVAKKAMETIKAEAIKVEAEVKQAKSKQTKGLAENTVDLSKLSRNERFIEQYHDTAVKLSTKYEIPWEAVMAQGILESAAGTSEMAQEKNNFFGIAAYEEDPSRASSFATAEEGWEGYYKNIANTPTYRNHGVFKGDNKTNPYVYIETIAEAGYCQHDDYVPLVYSIVDEVRNYANKRNWSMSKL